MNKPHPEELADAINKVVPDLKAYPSYFGRYASIYIPYLVCTFNSSNTDGGLIIIDIKDNAVCPQSKFPTARIMKQFRYEDYPHVNDMVPGLLIYIKKLLTPPIKVKRIKKVPYPYYKADTITRFQP